MALFGWDSTRVGGGPPAATAKPKIVLVPPGCGLSTFVEYVENPWHAGGNRHGIRDADAILRTIHDPQSGTNLVDAMGYYAQKVGGEDQLDKWHRLCFRALIKHQQQAAPADACGVILCGADLAQRGFDCFIGDGDIQSLTTGKAEAGVRKLRPEEVAVVLPDANDAARRGPPGERVDAAHAKRCVANYAALAERYPTQVRRERDLSFLLR